VKGWNAPVSARHDPGRTTGSTAGYAPLPPCEAPCQHLGTVHEPDGKKPHGRGPCRAADPNPCPCTTYIPEEASNDR
jgi:hypothetical protein